jgi:hypothetical protein
MPAVQHESMTMESAHGLKLSIQNIRRCWNLETSNCSWYVFSTGRKNFCQSTWDSNPILTILKLLRVKPGCQCLLSIHKSWRPKVALLFFTLISLKNLSNVFHSVKTKTWIDKGWTSQEGLFLSQDWRQHLRDSNIFSGKNHGFQSVSPQKSLHLGPCPPALLPSCCVVPATTWAWRNRGKLE